MKFFYLFHLLHLQLQSTVFLLLTFSEEKGELWQYEYDLSNRMVKVLYSECGSEGLGERAGYKYDYRGLCVYKTNERGVEYREYTADGRLIYVEKDGLVTDYVYNGSTIFAEVRVEGGKKEVYYHHTNHLGTTEVISDEQGVVVWEANYEAFGSVLSENGTKAFAASFTGKLYDSDVGLYYFNARWYDSVSGRFITQDPARDGSNWYGYCGQNPLTRIDWTGLEDVSEKEIAKAFLNGAKDGFVNIGKDIYNSVRHPIQSAKKDFEEIKKVVLHPKQTFKDNVDAIKSLANADLNTQAYYLGQMAVSASVGTSVANAAMPYVEGSLQKVLGIEKTDKLILTGTGEYKNVGGHHVHAKAGFVDNINYNPKKGFSISQEFMENNGLNHKKMTNMQRKLFKELAESGRPNTLAEHTRIAKEALKAGGATDELIEPLINSSLENLAAQGVTQPTNIPWYNK